MPVNKSGIKATALKELLDEALRYKTMEYVLRGRPDATAIVRRISDIRKGRCQYVTQRVADQICTAFGRPDWMQILE